MINRLKKSLGFTLTELVVTVAIMGTLAAVSIPSYLETNNKAKTEKTVANMYDLCNTIGQRFNALASEYGTVELLPDANLGQPEA
ncbi:MAG: prepilin-type N-terminal cleavage/methylation domain-containing protein, partial [Candidatus Marinimicrobia bacterium]|nr:prepilin-type N-terminal cleavage/methylation domain-containing protein [Candidatus Neomarinimicrobiota bacterium]